MLSRVHPITTQLTQAPRVQRTPDSRVARDTNTTEGGTQVVLSEEARARAEAARDAKAKDANRVSDPKHKQVLWSDTLWKENPSGTSAEPPKRPAPKVTLRPLNPPKPSRTAPPSQEANSASPPEADHAEGAEEPPEVTLPGQKDDEAAQTDLNDETQGSRRQRGQAFARLSFGKALARAGYAPSNLHGR